MKRSIKHLPVQLTYDMQLFYIGLVIKDTANGARGLGFDYRTGQIEFIAANGSPPLRRFFGAVLHRS